MTKVNLTIDVRQDSAEACTLDIQGEINAFAENILKDAYNQASSAGARSMLLNFTNLQYMNSSGIGLLAAFIGSAANAAKNRVFPI